MPIILFKYSCRSKETALYLTIVRSQLLFCSILWKPHLIKDINLIEKIQRFATKFFLNDYTSDYKTRLLKLKLLPLMHILDINDIIFLINSRKFPSNSFNIIDFVTFIFWQHSISQQS